MLLAQVRSRAWMPGLTGSRSASTALELGRSPQGSLQVNPMLQQWGPMLRGRLPARRSTR